MTEKLSSGSMQIAGEEHCERMEEMHGGEGFSSVGVWPKREKKGGQGWSGRG